MSDKKDAVKLTDMQKAVIAKRLELLQKDFELAAFHIRAKDGSEWVHNKEALQSVDKKKPKAYTRIRSLDTPGKLTRAALPWIELLAASGGGSEYLILREEDCEGIALPRIAGTFSSMINAFVGAKSVSTSIRRDAQGETLLYILLKEGKAEQLAKGLRFSTLKREGKIPKKAKLIDMDFYLEHVNFLNEVSAEPKEAKNPTIEHLGQLATLSNTNIGD